jgi:hypothetical protein
MLCITEKVSRKACETTCAQEGLPLLVCIGRIYVICVIFVYFFSSSHTYAFTWAAGAGGKISRDFFFGSGCLFSSLWPRRSTSMLQTIPRVSPAPTLMKRTVPLTKEGPNVDRWIFQVLPLRIVATGLLEVINFFFRICYSTWANCD